MPEKKAARQRLNDYFSGLGRVVVALSGGVDSSLVAMCAHGALGTGARAVTVKTEFTSGRQLETAAKVSHDIGIQHHIVSLSLLEDSRLAANGADRCYVCKRSVVKNIIAGKKEGELVLDGTNADDDPGRPGRKALKENGVLSPLEDCGLDKEAIRTLSRDCGLKNWNDPSDSCLATRLARGETITVEKLGMIEKMEEFLIGLGFTGVRARCGRRQGGNDLKVIVETPWNQRKIHERMDREIRREAARIGFKNLEYGERRQ